MKTIEIPQNLVRVEIKSLDKTVIIKEFSMGHRLRVDKDPEEDTAVNALLDCTELTLDELHGLSEREVREIYEIAIENTYPGIKDKLQSGELDKPSDEAVKDSKKN